MEFLSGWKTYIVAIVSVIGAWVAVWNGTMDFGTALQLTQTALLGSTIRAGVASEAKK